MVRDCIVPDLCFFFLALSYEKLFERKSNLVRDGLILVKGNLLTSDKCKIKE